MNDNFKLYRSLLGSAVIDCLLQMASLLKNIKIVHVNSTKEGGGVAEILKQMIPLTHALGLDVSWETIQGNPDFFRCTKMFHNLLQGEKTTPPDPSLLLKYEETNAENAVLLRNVLKNADIVFIHDPQPLALLPHFPDRTGKWIWRCHIDLSSPSDVIWKYLKRYVDLYDANIFSLKEYAPNLHHPIYIVPPSIDPFSEKNIELDPEEIQNLYRQYKIDTNRPTVLQVSRFDRFKDPLGVIQSYRLAKMKRPDLQLILAGSGAVDDPEGAEVFSAVQKEAGEDRDIFILLLPPTSHRAINALQRGANVVLQKSLKEGFGLTVAEALWKSKPVIGGNVGGIRLQIIDQKTGLLVNTPQETARSIEYLLQNPPIAEELGKNGKNLVTEKFLLTRHTMDYLAVITSHLFPDAYGISKYIQTIRNH